jgi:hypothetical protein
MPLIGALPAQVTRYYPWLFSCDRFHSISNDVPVVQAMQRCVPSVLEGQKTMHQQA